MIAIAYNFWSEWELREKVDFDGVNRLIIVHPDVTDLDIRIDVWSAWVRWCAIKARGYDRFYEAMERTGLDETPSGQLGNVSFLVNNWKLVVDLTNVKITGVLFSRDFETAYFTSDLLPQFPTEVSLVIGETTTIKNVISSTKEEIATEVLTQDISTNDNTNTLGGSVIHLKHLEYKIFIDTESIEPLEDQDGSQHHPYSNETTAIDYAEAHGLLSLQIKSDIDLTRNVRNFYVTSTNIKKVDTGTYNLEGSRFSHVELTGNHTGYVTAQDCNLSGGHLHGFFQNCAIGSDFIIPDLGRALIKDCTVFTEGFTVPPKFSIGGVSGTASLHLMNFVGGARITDCNQPTDNVKIVATGQVEIDSSCTDGDIIVFGLVKPVDNSGVGCNVLWENVDPDKLKDIPNDVADVIL